ncbi:MAG TPA: cation:proton antiporter [Gammaproteobacteria bacterium]|nr:cation:proton antiporter [Gammaproteobacteria bacterium]
MESTPAIEAAKHVLFIVGVILACGSVGGFVASKIRVPDIVVFLLAGILLGPAVSGLIDVASASTLNQLILIFGAAYIIFDGGATVELRVLKNVWISLIVIATVGVLVTAAIVGLAASQVFHIAWLPALLLGAVIASTDPATLVPVFKQVSIRQRVSHLVMSESALNDAMGAILTLTLIGVVVHQHFSAGHAVLQLAQQAGIGLLVGIVIGVAALLLIAHERYAFLREYTPLVTLIVVAGAYLGADVADASGPMAVFIAGLIIGNKDLLGFEIEHGEQKGLEDFIATTSLIMRMFIFILLGSQVDFGLLSANWVGGIIVIAVFMLVARPVTVFLCCLPDRRAKWELKELLFICWVRETGVIPAALAGLLLGLNAPHAQLIASVTFMAVLLTILLQATTTKWLGGKLGLIVEPAQHASLVLKNESLR